MHYIALIHKDSKSDYGVSFPDLPGLVTAGSSLDEARRMAEEALAFHLEGLMEDGEAIPAPSSLERVMADSVNRDGVATLVSVQPGQKPKHVNLSIPGDVLYQVDQRAKEKGYTRSEFMVRAAKRLLEYENL